MDPRLEVASQTGDVDSLYSLINEDEYILEHVDEVPFINTPLHIAAAAGHHYFCMEIMTLKPSYAKKLNKNGYSPIHLALQNHQTQLVLRLLDVDRDLVRVQGRERKTALHLAAELGMVELVAEFLSLSPNSIQDLTIRKETALHVAVKNDQLEVVKVLLGWLELVGKDGVLKWTDDEGNTILHVAAIRSQIEMLSLFINKSVDINAKNLVGLTALNIIQDESNQSNSRKLMRRMLLRGGALKAESLPKVPTLAESLKTKMSWHEKWIISDYRKRVYLSNEDRNIILLVAVLFATANYQAALDSNPYLQDNSESIAPTSYNYHGDYFDTFYAIFLNVNDIAFIASMVEIFIHLPSNCGILRLLLLVVICNYVLITLRVMVIVVITTTMLLFYHSKMAVILHKFVPILMYNKSVKIKRSILKRFTSFHGKLEA